MEKEGFLVLDKEAGMTSHDCVAIARRSLGMKKVGHAGTLDPMATGVLVLGFGNGTRLLQYITEGNKTYLATVVLGAATVTDDREGEIISRADTKALTDESIRKTLGAMIGTIAQRPSSVSAVKIDGERAYDRVRAGEKVELPTRQVTISQLDISRIERIDEQIQIDIEVTCSAGTYIRAIARDCGDTLEVGGHLSSLRRTRVGAFDIPKSISLAQLKDGDFTPLSLVDLAAQTFPVRNLGLDEVMELSFGRALTNNPSEEIYAAISSDNRLIALLANREGRAKPISVFAAAN